MESTLNPFLADNISLQKSIQLEDVWRVQCLLKNWKKFNVDLKELDSEAQTPLYSAIRSGNIDIIEAFLQAYQINQFDINETDQYGER